MNAGTLLALGSWLLVASIVVALAWSLICGIGSMLAVMPWVILGLVGLQGAIAWGVNLPPRRPTRWGRE